VDDSALSSENKAQREMKIRAGLKNLNETISGVSA
jgi:hypothetical protein